VADDLLALAWEWLEGALVHLGAGAKTNAGYGGFRPARGEPSRVAGPAPLACELTLELMTPAFLAGAHQQREDCELRPATLRGLLRWWWRTMHAGFVDVATLRQLEATVWGDTKAGGAVRITVWPLAVTAPQLFDKDKAVREHRLPHRPDNRTTPGLWYLSYGMDVERRVNGERTRYQRHFVPPGAKWRLRVAARRSWYPADAPPNKARAIPADAILLQAQAALWLLCRFGGVGSNSKARKRA